MRILMLGNSLTTANGMPQMLAELTGATVQVHARGGARLAEHVNPATKMGARTQAALQEGGWDYVVLQEMSHGPATSPDAYGRSVAGLAALTHAQLVLYGTWAYSPTCSKLENLGMTHEEMHQRMQEAFAQVAAKNHALLANVGAVFSEDLYAPDGVHPNAEGSTLAARVIAQAIAG